MIGYWAMSRAMDGAARIDASEARSKASDARRQVEALTARVDRMMLVCEALWTFVRERLNVTEEELVTRVNDIDLSDGKLDGKVRQDAVTCPRCGRKIARRFTQCMYCEQPMVHDPFA